MGGGPQGPGTKLMLKETQNLQLVTVVVDVDDKAVSFRALGTYSMTVSS